jgi:hypothetical protein
MSKLIYRVISPCRALGCGFPQRSFETALDGRVDAIVCGAEPGSAKPFLLGAGVSYFSPHEVRVDLERIVTGARRAGCPVILGGARSGGGDRNVAATVRTLAEVFAHLGIDDAIVATISSEIAGGRQSTVVGHMGVHPIVTALDGGAKYVIAGSACDASIFAADMIRRGIGPGLAYHVGHVLAYGATACEPGSPADCLVAEIYDDRWALFIPPNPQRRCTVYSIASHSLYGQSHPQLQIYPEGVLNTEATEFYARDARAAGIRGSRLVRRRPCWSIKLEGVRFQSVRDERILREELFPITFHEVRNGVWTAGEVRRPVYTDIADSDADFSMDLPVVSAIEDVEPRGLALANRRLVDMALVVRSQNAGIGHLTFDVFFSSEDFYEAALLSNAFCRANIAKALQIDLERVVGTYFVDACNAIKITIDRPVLAAGFPDSNLYREQKLAVLEELSVPIYAPTQPSQVRFGG